MVCFYCSSLIQGLQGGEPAEAFGCTGRGWGQHFWESDCYLTWVFSCLTLLYWEVHHPVEASGCTGRLGRGRAAQHPPRQPRPPLTPHTPQLDPPSKSADIIRNFLSPGQNVPDGFQLVYPDSSKTLPTVLRYLGSFQTVARDMHIVNFAVRGIFAFSSCHWESPPYSCPPKRATMVCFTLCCS